MTVIDLMDWLDMVFGDIFPVLVRFWLSFRSIFGHKTLKIFANYGLCVTNL